MFIIEKFSADNKVLFDEALKIRMRVFVDEQGVNPELEKDNFEEFCTHYLVLKKTLPVGYLISDCSIDKEKKSAYEGN